jgi:hypothetical protein
MHLRAALAAAGVAVTAFLLVTVAVIELLAFEFSAIVAVPVGLIAAVVAFVAVFAEFRFAGTLVRRAAAAVAGFGYAVLALLAAGYVNLGGLRSVLGVDVVVATGAVTAAAVYLGLWAHERRDVAG